jgi:hypothetical protein
VDVPPLSKQKLFGAREIIALNLAVLPFFISFVVGRNREAHGGIGLSYRLDLFALACGIGCLLVALKRPRPVLDVARQRRLALSVGFAMLAIIQIARGIGLLHVVTTSDGSPLGLAKLGSSQAQAATLRETARMAAQLSKQGAPGTAAMWKGELPKLGKHAVVFWHVPKNSTPDGWSHEVEEQMDEMRGSVARSPFDLVVFKLTGPQVNGLPVSGAMFIFVRDPSSGGWSRDKDETALANMSAEM